MLRRTPITIVPPGYKPDLDRLPPREGAGCARVLFLALTFALICAVLVWGASTLLAQPATDSASQPLTLVPQSAQMGASATPSPSPTLTLDAWSATGTALFYATQPPATPTLDYCWWLTPSPTPSMTPVPVTPDAWALQGTAIYLQTGTPTHTPTATQASPRAWCDAVPTATLTPFPIVRLGATLTPSTATPTPMQIIIPTDEPVLRATAAPVQPINQPPAVQPPVQQVVVTSPPVVIVQTQVIIHTAVPPVPPTIAPTATATTTATPTPTLTPSPTLAPALAVSSATCSAGYPEFAVVNMGGVPSDWIQWAILLNGQTVWAGTWQVSELLTPMPLRAVAANVAGIAGTYQLVIYQFWDSVTPTISASVVCAPPPPTLAPPPTTEPPTAEATNAQ